MTRNDFALLHGTLDFLILKSVSWGARHGYGIARWIEDGTDNVIAVEEGSLYPALYRMERRGWIEAEWSMSDQNRRVKLYRLTTDGRRQLRAETRDWERFANAVSAILLTT
jgi:PadR family transcriptional regulator, regulatory protein PadR